MAVVMEVPLTTAGPQTSWVTSWVSWPAVVAGGVVAAALTLVLAAFGAGVGLSSISPWADSGVSAATFKTGTGIYLCVMAVLASSIGGYLAARLRAKWSDLHTKEVFFRDTAHGLIAWALATVLSAGALAAATTHIASGGLAGVGGAVAQAPQNGNPNAIYVDKLLRTDPSTPPPGAAPLPAAANADATRGELLRLWTVSFRDNRDLSTADSAYVARLVAARTGLSQADAQKRVNDVVTEAKAAADRARRNAAHLALWLTASMLLGAFAASLAAVEGGQYRDGMWSGNVYTRRPL